ncbi:MAG: protein-glutamate O-methyltransferase [Alphaproteobacteria bacterium]|nr:protein-glutamate O-methyltransferase [Alphaproteobacteria bacterium]
MAKASQKSDDEREFSFSDQQFKFLADLANKRTGIVLAEHKKDMVYSRLVRRLRALRLGSFAEYCDMMQGEEGKEELGNLVNAITTNLTSFFREGHHFEHLRDKVFADLIAQRPSPKRLRIWSAGCSAGMEPYSIAMMIKAGFKDWKSWDAKILATDIDTNMLGTGMEGEYASEQYENIPPSCRSDVQKLAKTDKIRMSDELKSMIAFKPLNLLESWPMKGPFDAVFCRNVVIYFDKPTQAKLFNRIADLIKPDGWLYIGHSENLFKVCDRFELVGRTIYRKVR